MSWRVEKWTKDDGWWVPFQVYLRRGGIEFRTGRDEAVSAAAVQNRHEGKFRYRVRAG